ncbi:hypothetical protein [Ilumatobacter nonamiensis]|uniref:hypothetical protein n=1 Tax=Ilumatobacter nonamiensis TaxID=467093 RepID=UPI0011D20FEA|nr:hypothetical protein [Ilumatobacter nonamiensis]
MHSFRSMIATALVAAVVLAACGSDETDQPSASTDAASDTMSDPTVGTVPSSGDVLGTGNVGGPVVDPKPHPIDGIDIAESYPEQLVVRFTSGDPNCTAADATATADGDEVVVALLVGITEDALARSCLAGEVEQSVTVALDEGLDGREVVVS